MAKRTCAHGHRLTKANTYVVPATGQVMCRECQRAASKRRRERLREEVDAIKRRRGCKDCGEREGPLHFDHRPDEVKLFNVGSLRGSRDAIMAEIKKCDVRCASCHSTRHGLERGAWVVAGDLLCWQWVGYCDKDGTPIVRTKTSTTTARRFYWERENGPVPEGLVLWPMCENRKCVRGSHMMLVSRSELLRRQGRTVLSPHLAARAIAMRQNGVSGREVGRRLEVSEKTIREVMDGTHWTVRKEGRNERARMAGRRGRQRGPGGGGKAAGGARGQAGRQ